VDVARNTAALLALIEEDRVRRCAEIESAAASAAAELLRGARSAARARVREALALERRRLRERLAACDARLATEARQHDQRRFRALLDETWKRLPHALEARWADATRRAAWVGHVVDSARELLPAGNWQLVHAPGWPQAEREALAADLARSGITARFAEDASRGPGLEVRADGNRVDGTAAGLTADAGEIGACLLECLPAGAGGTLP
jgi:hypothetical protein